MRNTFKTLLLSLFTIAVYSQSALEFNLLETSDKAKDLTAVHSLDSKELMQEGHFILNENDSALRCGFLELKSPFRTDKIVRATKEGCFRWVFSKNGKVTSVSDFMYIKQGESKRGFGKSGETVGISCPCRRVRSNY